EAQRNARDPGRRQQRAHVPTEHTERIEDDGPDDEHREAAAEDLADRPGALLRHLAALSEALDPQFAAPHDEEQQALDQEAQQDGHPDAESHVEQALALREEAREEANRGSDARMPLRPAVTAGARPPF